MKHLSNDEKKRTVEALYQRISLRLNDDGLALQALTHPSFSHEVDGDLPSYDRLEFLGDTVVNLVIGEALMRRIPHIGSGLLTQLRARIINRSGLYTLAVNLGISELLLLGEGEERSGGRIRESTLSDIMESIVGAVYLDQGFDTAREMILRVAKNELEAVCREKKPHNPKGELQEHCLKIYSEPPVYTTLSMEGPPHDPVFTVAVFLKQRGELGRGSASNRRNAEEQAAATALERLKQGEA